MALYDDSYLDKILKRLEGYKKPNDTQKLIMLLGNKQDKSLDDEKKLKILLTAEKKADQLNEARAKARRLLTAEKSEKRKLETRKKIIWGSALVQASKDNPEIAQVMQKLFDDGFIGEKDLDIVKDDLNFNKTTSIEQKNNTKHKEPIMPKSVRKEMGELIQSMAPQLNH